jgi:hypothetical protein
MAAGALDPMQLALWNHQRAAITACENYFATATDRAALIHYPTGTGKTGIMAVIAARRSQADPVLVICPSAALVGQLGNEFRADFWQRIGAPAHWAPEQVLRLLPSEVDDVVAKVTGAAAGVRTVVIGTVQTLQRIHAGEDYAKLQALFGTILFDEGHREPAPAWAKAVRGFNAPTVLFSATPFRNDFKLFKVDDDHIAFLSFRDAVAQNLVRGVTIEERALPGGVQAFAQAVVAWRDALVANGDARPADKLIVRTAPGEDVLALFDAFNAALAGRNDGVLAIHDGFARDGVPGSERRGDVPANLRQRAERFLIHEQMLIEGIDDPACTMLAVHEPFGNERQLVQQVGRLIRHPGPPGAVASPARVLARTGDDVAAMWSRFRKYDDACIANGGRPPIRNDEGILEKLIEALPSVDYIDGRFRERADLGGDLEEDLRVPRSAVVFDLSPDFSLDAFQAEVSAGLFEDDRFEKQVGNVAGGNCRYHLSVRLRQSPFLAESLFQSATLELTIYARHGARLFFYDSAGLWVDDHKALSGRVGTRSLQSLLPDGTGSAVTAVTMKNTDLGRHAVRSRSLGARSLEQAGVFMGEQLNVITRAEGRVEDMRRAIGFARSRIRQGEGADVTASGFFDWTRAMAAEIDAAAAPATLFSRFALPAGQPADTTPINILVDLDAFAGSFLNEAGAVARFGLDNACVDIVPQADGPRDFPYRFELVVDGAPAPVWIRWDKQKRKYWLHSEVLSSLKLRENDRISLTRRLNQLQPFRIVPLGAAAIYAYGRFYAVDLNLARAGGAGAMVLDLIEGVVGLRSLKSEKGTLDAAAATWPADSLFGLIDRALVPGSLDPMLGEPFLAFVCDDIGDEAADFIAADRGRGDQSPRAVLIAAKWKKGKPGVSASNLYDVCGQVVKNLAYLKVDAVELPGSPNKWDQDWTLNGGQVSRRRTATTAAAFRKLFREVRANPAADRSIWMVLGGGTMSRKAVRREFQKHPPEAHVLQFFHLVLSTYATCQSVGVDLRIICAE